MMLHMDITRWSIPKSDLLCSLQLKMKKFYTVSKNKTWSWLGLRSFAPYCKIQAKMEESRENLLGLGQTTRPFEYDLNQIPYDYTVEVINRFKGLDLVDSVPEELWIQVRTIVWEAVTKAISKKKKCKKAKWLSEEALQIAKKRRDVKGKGDRERYTNWMQSSTE